MTCKPNRDVDCGNTGAMIEFTANKAGKLYVAVNDSAARPDEFLKCASLLPPRCGYGYLGEPTSPVLGFVLVLSKAKP